MPDKSEGDIISEEYSALFYILYGIEFVLIIFSTLAFAIGSYFLIETPLLHTNFMRLYKCLCAEFLVFTLARVVKLIATFAEVKEASK